MNRGKYIYLVFYHCKNGKGTTKLLRTEKIKHEDDIEGIQQWLQNNYNIENVGIACYQLIRKIPIWERCFTPKDGDTL